MECKAAKGGLPNTKPEELVLAAVSIFKFKKDSMLGEGKVEAFDGFVLKSNMLWFGEPVLGLDEDKDERESSVATSGDRVRIWEPAVPLGDASPLTGKSSTPWIASVNGADYTDSKPSITLFNDF